MLNTIKDLKCTSSVEVMILPVCLLYRGYALVK